MSKNVKNYQNNVALVKKLFYTLFRVEKVLEKTIIIYEKIRDYI